MRHVIPAIAIGAAALATTPVAVGGPPSMHDITARTLLDDDPFLDAVSGNGWDRSDLFTNTSSNWTVTIESIDIVMMDPEDVQAVPSFDDIFGHPDSPPTNVFEVLEAAASDAPELHPDWGANWWPTVNTIEVDWQSSEFFGAQFPVTLQPGQSFELFTRCHNGVFGQFFNSLNDYGELVIGFELSGEVTPAPTACTGDVNGDGEVNVADLIAVILAWNLTDSPADVDGSGIVDVGDLVTVVLNWGDCPE